MVQKARSPISACIGSIFAGLYAKVTRIAPERAGQLSTAILDIGERIEHAHSLDELECLQEELEAILRGAIVGLRDGSISTDGLDTFKLGYEFVRDEIGMRRDYLKRHASDKRLAEDAEKRQAEADKAALPNDDTNVVVVKTAHSA